MHLLRSGFKFRNSVRVAEGFWDRKVNQIIALMTMENREKIYLLLANKNPTLFTDKKMRLF